jgi:hypothetical protein
MAFAGCHGGIWTAGAVGGLLHYGFVAARERIAERSWESC